MEIKNKTIIITGASEGLGKAIAYNLAKEKANLVLLARNKEKLEKVAKNIPNALVISCDVTKPNEIKNAIKKTLDKFKSIDIVINNAGIWCKLQPLEEISIQEINDVIDINLKGVINVSKYALPFLKTQNESMLINISSHSGVKAKHLQSIYCGAKFGVRGFTEALKIELSGTNVKVVGFYPSGMNTQMFNKTGEKFNSEEFMKVEDIAKIITFIIKQPSNICIEEIWVDKFSKKR